eukprot:3616556-Rhodomonas_salina.1
MHLYCESGTSYADSSTKPSPVQSAVVPRLFCPFRIGRRRISHLDSVLSSAARRVLRAAHKALGLGAARVPPGSSGALVCSDTRLARVPPRQFSAR